MDLSLYTINSLRPVSYLNKLSNRKSVGLIADELLEHYPHLVFGESHAGELLSIDYISLIPILIKEIQILKTVIQTLKTVLTNNNIT